MASNNRGHGPMFGFPKGTTDRITSTHMEDRANISGRREPTEQKGWEEGSLGDKEEDRPTEGKASQRPNENLVEE
ncbi:hypothetical protein NDU88_004776 [Pleurodeles waltl]|uniref:Uncharacterized protein n=1 Tax=Pleurodeles waltl TaxID=8319 RepID=A0AAV7WWH1_PLEWA|nr:hypothetical protein NDU88_004776 [Pleurodeles waltl]